MKPTPVSLPAAIAFIVVGIIIAIVSQRDDEPRNLPRGEVATPGVEREEVPASRLRGTWVGIAYQDQYGSFRPTIVPQRDDHRRVLDEQPEPEASIEATIDVEDKFLQIKGVEACRVTLTLNSREKGQFESQEIYRIHPATDPTVREAKPFERSEAEMTRHPISGTPRWSVEERHDYLVLKRGTSMFQVIRLDEHEMEIRGRVHDIGAASILHPIHLVLRRAAPSSE